MYFCKSLNDTNTIFKIVRFNSKKGFYMNTIP